MKNILSFFLIIFLTICFIFSLIETLLYCNLFNLNSLKKQLEKNNFYSETYNLVMKNFSNYIDQSGFDENILEGIYTEEDVKNDINNILDNIYLGTNNSVDALEIKENLNKKIDELGVKNEYNQKAIDEFVDSIYNEYFNTIIKMEYENEISNSFLKIKYWVKNIIIATYIFIAILVVASLKININNIGISLISSGIFTVISYLYINKSINVSNIVVITDAMSKLIISIICAILKTYLFVGTAFITAGIIIICTHEELKKKIIFLFLTHFYKFRQKIYAIIKMNFF